MPGWNTIKFAPNIGLTFWKNEITINLYEDTAPSIEMIEKQQVEIAALGRHMASE